MGWHHDRLSKDVPNAKSDFSAVFAVKVFGAVTVVLRANNGEDAVSKACMFAANFYSRHSQNPEVERAVHRLANNAELLAFTEAEKTWRGEAKLAAVFFEAR